MEILLNIGLLILGLVFLIKGADFFVSGASAIAKKLKVPAIIIGLTVVAIGTSLPELAVSVSSAISGSVDMAVGNVIGSNLSNMLLILGIVATISCVKVKESSKKFDFPMLILVTGLLLIFSCDILLNGQENNIISRTESIILLLIFVYYIVKNVKNAKNGQKEEKTEQNENAKILKNWQIVVYVILGLVAVVFGGEFVSRSAQFLAIKAGMSETLVGLTIVALGTSLPELATSIIASKKGESDLAVGNIIGSNILNIVLILGAVGTITNISVSSELIIDLLILFVLTLFFVFIAIRKMQITRLWGIVLIVLYVLYMTYAILRNYLL